MTEKTVNQEKNRLEAQRLGKEDWRLWGPYLSERAWGTVREDYSPRGAAWEAYAMPGSGCAWRAPAFAG